MYRIGFVALLLINLIACSKQDEPKTPAQQAEHERLYAPGKPTDRTKSKSY